MEPFSPQAVRSAYDTTADDYVPTFGNDLDRLPVDRAVLDVALAAAQSSGWVLEAGCGPGPAARYLADRAPRIVGVDLSERMLRAGSANGLCPTLADLRRLPLRDGCCALVIAYYCLQHLHRDELPLGLAELRRVLRHDGVLAIATHLGDGDVFVDELLGHRISTIGGALYRRGEILDALLGAGFSIEHEQQRPPLPHEYDRQRIYLIARHRGSGVTASLPGA